MSYVQLNIWMGFLLAAVVVTVLFPLFTTLSDRRWRWFIKPALVLIVVLWAVTITLTFIYHFGSN